MVKYWKNRQNTIDYFEISGKYPFSLVIHKITNHFIVRTTNHIWMFVDTDTDRRTDRHAYTCIYSDRMNRFTVIRFREKQEITAAKMSFQNTYNKLRIILVVHIDGVFRPLCC